MSSPVSVVTRGLQIQRLVVVAPGQCCNPWVTNSSGQDESSLMTKDTRAVWWCNPWVTNSDITPLRTSGVHIPASSHVQPQSAHCPYTIQPNDDCRARSSLSAAVTPCVGIPSRGIARFTPPAPGTCSSIRYSVPIIKNNRAERSHPLVLIPR